MIQALDTASLPGPPRDDPLIFYASWRRGLSE